MEQKDSKSSEEVVTNKSPKVKKPYVKPAFRFERVFETMALACGKVNRLQPGCHFNRKNS
jgi:hypothetical protein